MSYPAAPVDGQFHIEAGNRRSYVAAESAWRRAPADLVTEIVTTGGAVTVDVSNSWDGGAVELTLGADLTSLAWSGWDTTAGLHQEVMVTVKQDTVGARNFDWRAITGIWGNDPPDIAHSSFPGDIIGRFRASSNDAGTTVWLELEGQSYERDPEYRFRVVAEPVPALTGTFSRPGTATFRHDLNLVSSVHVISKGARGERLDTAWWQTDGEGSADVNVDFAFDVADGDYEVRIAGQSAKRQAPSVSSIAWQTLPINVTGAGNLRIRTQHDGLASEAEVIWPDGSKVAAGNNAVLTHSATGPGMAYLRWRRDVSMSTLDMANSTVGDLSIPAIELPGTLSTLSLSNTASTMAGAWSDLPEGLTSYFSSTSDVALVGSFLHPALTVLHAGNSECKLISGLSSLPAGLTDVRLFGTQSVISGDLSEASGALLTLHLNTTPSSVEWTTPTGTLPFSGALNLSYTATGGSMTSAQINGLLADMVTSNATPSGLQTIGLQGGHAPPDSTSGGVDGLAAIATLQASGWTVNT